MAGIQAVPTSECTLILFISHLASSNISQGTIKVYLSAVRHIHVCRGLHNHFNHQITPRLHLILRGIKKHQLNRKPPKTRLPITIQMLHTMRTLLAKKAPSFYNTTLWAMCCLAFFGFLRVSEFTIPTDSPYDPSRHLSLNDMAVDNRKNPRLLQLHLKESKADPFKQGVKVYVGATDSPVCPIKAMLSYLSKRSKKQGPLFITKEGTGWTGAMFRAGLKSLMADLQLDKHCYNTHSLRIGAATSASLAKLPEAHIQILGRWRSNAFKRYIRPPPNEVASFSGIIAAGHR